MNEKLMPVRKIGQQANIRRHWLVFAFTLFLGLIVLSGIYQNWGEGFGAVLVPAAAGFFLVRGGTGVSGLVLRYSTFMAIFIVLISGSIIRAITETHIAVETSCLTKNGYTAELSTEKRVHYCQCISDKMDDAIVRYTATSFLTFKPRTDNIQDIPELLDLATNGANQCARLASS